jgi:glutamate-ammonia-ligase adenylyltransferase
LISEAELTELFSAYEFLRQLEHVLQMESGLQTHTVPDDDGRRNLVARRMRLRSITELNREINKHSSNTHRIFERVFAFESAMRTDNDPVANDSNQRIVRMDDRGGLEFPSPPESLASTTMGARISTLFRRHRYQAELETAIDPAADFREKLGRFRRAWSRLQTEIKTADLHGEVTIRDAKNAQTALAEASIETALEITRHELARRYRTELGSLPVAVMGLGKLGGAGIDYDSDLDLVLLYDDGSEPFGPIGPDITPAEFYGRAAEIFVTTLSSMTRDGSIYRVDLRLRPYGKNGQSIIGAGTFADYMRDSAVIWEWLAYVKLRAVGGEMALATDVESRVREIIHNRALNAGADQLATETRRVRLLLEKEKAGRRRSNDIDIKYGSGGMLDVYFAMRYLQLRDNVPDHSDDRSTDFMLRLLYENGSLASNHHETLLYGYRFLSGLDHYLRLAVGRTTRLPLANQKGLEFISERMGLESSDELLERLTIHRLNIRNVFDSIVGNGM